MLLFVLSLQKYLTAMNCQKTPPILIQHNTTHLVYDPHQPECGRPISQQQIIEKVRSASAAGLF